jgi:uncharacterized membrane protein
MKNKILLCIILCLYFLVGANYSKKQGFWHDEIYTLTFLQGISAYNFEGNTLDQMNCEITAHSCKGVLGTENFLNNFRLQILHEGHPPVYFVLLKGWSELFGVSEFGLRSFSLFCGLGFIFLFFTLVEKKFGSSVAWYSIIPLLLSPYLFYYFSEARMYSLGLLIAALAFKFWMDWRDEMKFLTKKYCLMIFFSMLLVYTHYYGLFFLGALFFIDFVEHRFKTKIILSQFYLVLFLPWLFVIPYQTNYHTIHWTDGALPFGESLIGFFTGLITMPFNSQGNSDFLSISTFIVVLTASFYVLRKEKLGLLMSIGVFLFYFLEVFVFDCITNHHTIIVNRYYIFFLIFLYWSIAFILYKAKGVFKFFPLGIFVLISFHSLFEVYSLKESPKQMIKEVANYIDSKYDSNNTMIVVEPSGVAIWGLSLYLNKDFQLVPASSLSSMKYSKRIIFVDEMLGDKNWENHLNNEDQSQRLSIPFVGITLYE